MEGGEVVGFHGGSNSVCVRKGGREEGKKEENLQYTPYLTLSTATLSVNILPGISM